MSISNLLLLFFKENAGKEFWICHSRLSAKPWWVFNFDIWFCMGILVIGKRGHVLFSMKLFVIVSSLFLSSFVLCASSSNVAGTSESFSGEESPRKRTKGSFEASAGKSSYQSWPFLPSPSEKSVTDLTDINFFRKKALIIISTYFIYLMMTC